VQISVVVLVFNLESYIAEAIDSVLAQTRPADEIIVVDDCSTDGSAAIVKSYGSKVRYVRMPQNSGALLAALEGVKAARGEILCMLDGDDYWAVDKLAAVEREFGADPDLVLLSHDHVRVDENGTELPIRDDTHRNIAAVRRQATSPGHFSDLLKDSILNQKGYWLGSAYAFRKAAFDLPKFDQQIAAFGTDGLRDTYLDLTIAPFLVLTNPRGSVGYARDTRFFYRVHDQGSLAGNVTPEKAQRSALKGRRINELINRILEANNAAPAYLRRRGLLLEEYDFLIALYSREFGKALRLYWRLAFGSWDRIQLVKETKRLLAVFIVGPERFLRLKQRQTRT